MIVVYILVGLYGLCVGSFLNVVIYRLPNNMNLAKPGSHCTTCGYELRWYDNIPVLSYLTLGGKCRKCKEHISFRYTLVELLNMALWLLSAWLFWETSWLYSIAVMLFCSLLICIGFIDLETMYIHDLLVYLLAVPIVMAGVAYVLDMDDPALIVNRLIGVAVGGGLFLAVWLVFRLVMKKEGMGIADVILMAFVGAFLGWEATIVAMLIASLLGCAILIPIQFIRKKERDTEYPFAPFLTLGAVAAVFVTEPLLGWYLGLCGF